MVSSLWAICAVVSAAAWAQSPPAYRKSLKTGRTEQIALHRPTAVDFLRTGRACPEVQRDGAAAPVDTDATPIRTIDPPEQGFFAKELDYHGIPIKAPAVVDDRALRIARDRMARLLEHLPNALYNLTVAGAELHIIGRDQVTSDLPEHRHLKGKPFDGKLTVDQRTRGLGGLLTSCGEENLLELPTDRYRGRDICTHEFSHNLQDQGFSADVRERIRDQYHKSLDRGLWKGAYAGTNEHEFWAELTMWYFGTHGDLNMTGEKPANGRDGLKAYDPDAYRLLDAIYAGRVPVARVETVTLKPYPPDREKNLRSGGEQASVTVTFVNHTPYEVRLYWIDGDGKRHAYGKIAPGGRTSQNTFASHVWLASGPDDRAIALFVAGMKQGIALIRQRRSAATKCLFHRVSNPHFADTLP